MKLFSIILSFLILSMAILPCGDEGEKENGNHVEFSSKKSGETHNAEPDYCNAFCQCARCPFSVVVPESDDVLFGETFPFIHRVEVTVAPTGVSFDIWQPPREA